MDQATLLNGVIDAVKQQAIYSLILFSGEEDQKAVLAVDTLQDAADQAKVLQNTFLDKIYAEIKEKPRSLQELAIIIDAWQPKRKQEPNVVPDKVAPTSNKLVLTTLDSLKVKSTSGLPLIMNKHGNLESPSLKVLFREDPNAKGGYVCYGIQQEDKVVPLTPEKVQLVNNTGYTCV